MSHHDMDIALDGGGVDNEPKQGASASSSKDGDEKLLQAMSKFETHRNNRNQQQVFQIPQQRSGRGDGNSKWKANTGLSSSSNQWVGAPQMTGSSFWSQLESSDKKFCRRPYPFNKEQHPVFILQQHHPLAAIGQLEPMIELPDKDTGKFKDETPKVSMWTQGDIASPFLKTDPLVGSEQHVDEPNGDKPEQQASNNDSSRDVNASILKQLGIQGASIYYYVPIYVPRTYLKSNATHLFDFDTSHAHIQHFSQAVTFVIKSFTDSIGIPLFDENKKHGMNPAYYEDEITRKEQPRLRTFVEVVLSNDKMTGQLPADPENEELFRAMKAPDSQVLRDICRSENIAGYRVHFLFFDRRLHPSTCFKNRVFASQEERGLIPPNVRAYKRAMFLGNRESMQVMAEYFDKEDDRDENEEKKGKRKKNKKKSSDDDDGSQAEESDGEDSSDADSKLEAAVKVSKDDKKGEETDENKKKKKRRYQTRLSPAGGFDAMALKAAELQREPDPRTYYRNIFTFERMSRYVVHPYLKACHSPLALAHPDGLYASTDPADNIPLDDDRFDLHDATRSFLHFVNWLTFDNSVALAELTLERHEGEVCAINSLQSCVNSYFVGNERLFSFPYPHLVFEFRPQDLDPELNCLYRIPWQTSALDAILESFERRIRLRSEVLQTKQAMGEDVSEYMNHPTKLFVRENSFTFLSLAEKKNSARNGHLSDVDVDGYLRDEEYDPNDYTKLVPVRRLRAHEYLRPLSHDIDSIDQDALVQMDPLRDISNVNGFWTEQPAEKMFSSSSTHGTQSQVRYSLDPKNDSSIPSDANEVMKRRKEADDERVAAARLRRNIRRHEIIKETKIYQSKLMQTPGKSGTKDIQATKNGLFEKLLEQGEHLLIPATVDERNRAMNEYDSLYEGKTDEQRKLLARIRNMCNCAINRTLYDELTYSTNGGGGMLEGNQCADLAFGDRLEEARAKLSSTKLESIFAKQRTKKSELMLRIIRTVSCLPIKTEERSKDILPASANGKWTYELEERYRKDVLLHMMDSFYKEALADTLGLLTLDNPDLPEVHKGFLIHVEQKKDKRFFMPRFTMDTTMSRWGNRIANDMMGLEVLCGAYQAHLLVIQLLYSFRFNILKLGVAMRMNLLIHGPPGSEKSQAYGVLMSCSISSAFMATDYQSKRAMMTAQPIDHVMKVCDEAQPWLIGDYKKMSSSERAERDEHKKMISSQELGFQRNVESATKKGKGSRELESVLVSHQNAYLSFANVVQHTNEMSMLDRFRVMTILPFRRNDCTMGQRVLFSKFDARNDTLKDQFQKQQQNMHALTGIFVTIQNCRGLPDTNTSLLPILIDSGIEDISAFAPGIDSRARAFLRADGEAESLTWCKMVDRVQSSEVSPWLIMSKECDRIVDSTEIRFENVYNQFASGLFAEYDQCLFSMTNFFLEHISLRKFELLFEAISELCGYNRDFYLPTYQKYKIPVLDIHKRALERGDYKEYVRGTKSVQVEEEEIDPETGEIKKVVREKTELVIERVGDPDACSFVREFHELETKLKARASVIRPKGPSLEFGPKVDSESMEEKFNREQRLNQLRYRRQARGKPLTPDEEEETERLDQHGKVRCELNGDDGNPAFENKNHPTFLVCFGSDYQFAKQMLAIVNKYEENIDMETVVNILNTLKNINIRVPVFKGADRCHSDTLEFEGTEPLTGGPDDTKEEKARGYKGQVHYMEVPIIEYKRLDSSRQRNAGILRFAADYFVRRIPHHMLYMFLSAHENTFTRELSFPLPIQIRGYPSLLHRWDVKKRHKRVLRIVNPLYVPEASRKLIAPVDPSLYSNAVAADAVFSRDKIDQRNTVQYVFDTDDVEKILYSKFLEESFYRPSYVKKTADYSDGNKTDSERWSLFCNQHYYAPGKTEELIRYRREKWRFYTENPDFKTIRYPDDLLRSSKSVAKVKRAQKLRAERDDQELLTQEEAAVVEKMLDEISKHRTVPEHMHRTDEQKKEDDEYEADIKKKYTDLIAYLKLSMISQMNRNMEQVKRYEELQKTYRNVDWVLEYLLIKVEEEEKQEKKQNMEINQRYRERIHSDHKQHAPSTNDHHGIPISKEKNPYAPTVLPEAAAADDQTSESTDPLLSIAKFSQQPKKMINELKKLLDDGGGKKEKRKEREGTHESANKKKKHSSQKSISTRNEEDDDDDEIGGSSENGNSRSKHRNRSKQRRSPNNESFARATIRKEEQEENDGELLKTNSEELSASDLECMPPPVNKHSFIVPTTTTRGHVISQGDMEVM